MHTKRDLFIPSNRLARRACRCRRLLPTGGVWFQLVVGKAYAGGKKEGVLSLAGPLGCLGVITIPNAGLLGIEISFARQGKAGERVLKIRSV